jgi:hypothetical protein
MATAAPTPLDLTALKEQICSWLAQGLDDNLLMRNLLAFLKGTSQTIVIGKRASPSRRKISQTLRELYRFLEKEHLQNAFIAILEHTEYPFDLDSVSGLRHAIQIRDRAPMI